jgi:hypothetical protein
MNLQGKVPVEQLDDERLTNIERKLVVAVSDMRAPAERAPRRLLAFAGMAMAVMIAGLVGWKLRGGAPASEPMVEVPQRLAINTDTSNTVKLDDAVLTSGPGSDLVVERTRGRVLIVMTRGTIDMQVKHDPNRVLVVRAGDTEIEDIGTRFSVEYDGTSHVEVRVTEGEVKVKRAGQHVDVAAGFAWTADRGKLTIAALDAATTTVVATAPTAQPVQPAKPTVSTIPAPNPHVTPSAPETGSAAGSGSGDGSGSAATVVRKAGKSNARVALDKLAIMEPLDVGTKDFNTAIAKYLDLAVSMGDAQDKTEVLYSMAVVQHRARQDRAALYTLSGVIKRQGGKAYKAALWLNVRIECMQRFDDECRQAADLYLRKVPDGVAAGVAQAILTEIARQ